MQRHVMPVPGNVPSNGRHQLRIIDMIKHGYWQDDFHEAANFRLLCHAYDVSHTWHVRL